MNVTLENPQYWWLSSEEPACKAGDEAVFFGSIPGSGRSAGEGHGNPLQYSFLENPMSRPWGHKRVGHDLETKRQQRSWYNTSQVVYKGFGVRAEGADWICLRLESWQRSRLFHSTLESGAGKVTFLFQVGVILVTGGFSSNLHVGVSAGAGRC